jgi:hypothetical protein
LFAGKTDAKNERVRASEPKHRGKQGLCVYPFLRFFRKYRREGFNLGVEKTQGQRLTVLSIAAIPVFRVNAQALRGKRGKYLFPPVLCSSQ